MSHLHLVDRLLQTRTAVRPSFATRLIVVVICSLLVGGAIGYVLCVTFRLGLALSAAVRGSVPVSSSELSTRSVGAERSSLPAVAANEPRTAGNGYADRRSNSDVRRSLGNEHRDEGGTGEIFAGSPRGAVLYARGEPSESSALSKLLDSGRQPVLDGIFLPRALVGKTGLISDDTDSRTTEPISRQGPVGVAEAGKGPQFCKGEIGRGLEGTYLTPRSGEQTSRQNSSGRDRHAGGVFYSPTSVASPRHLQSSGENASSQHHDVVVGSADESKLQSKAKLDDGGMPSRSPLVAQTDSQIAREGPVRVLQGRSNFDPAKGALLLNSPRDEPTDPRKSHDERRESAYQLRDQALPSLVDPQTPLLWAQAAKPDSRGVAQSAARWAHNPEVAGAIPASAIVSGEIAELRRQPEVLRATVKPETSFGVAKRSWSSRGNADTWPDLPPVLASPEGALALASTEVEARGFASNQRRQVAPTEPDTPDRLAHGYHLPADHIGVNEGGSSGENVFSRRSTWRREPLKLTTEAKGAATSPALAVGVDDRKPGTVTVGLTAGEYGIPLKSEPRDPPRERKSAGREPYLKPPPKQLIVKSAGLSDAFEWPPWLIAPLFFALALGACLLERREISKLRRLIAWEKRKSAEHETELLKANEQADIHDRQYSELRRELEHANREIERLNSQDWAVLLLLTKVRKTVQTWLDKQGHDRCWYYPDLFREIATALELKPTVAPKLPTLEEFREGCRRYQDEEYGLKRDELERASTSGPCFVCGTGEIGTKCEFHAVVATVERSTKPELQGKPLPTFPSDEGSVGCSHPRWISRPIGRRTYRCCAVCGAKPNMKAPPEAQCEPGDLCSLHKPCAKHAKEDGTAAQTAICNHSIPKFPSTACEKCGQPVWIWDTGSLFPVRGKTC